MTFCLKKKKSALALLPGIFNAGSYSEFRSVAWNRSFCFLAFKKCLVESSSEITEKCRALEESQEVPEILFAFLSECVVLRCLAMGFYCTYSYRHFTFFAVTTATTYSTDNLKTCLY